jgi:hypothetical protein
VANRGHNTDNGDFVPAASITELNATTGKFVRVISGPADEAEDQEAMAPSGPDLFLAGFGYSATAGDRVVELNAATGKQVRVISGRAYHFSGPDAVVRDGDELFVANFGSYPYALTEINAFTGKLVRVVSGPGYQFAGPDDIAPDGPNLFVANGLGGSVTELPR